jgi:hypothetical protein
MTQMRQNINGKPAQPAQQKGRARVKSGKTTTPTEKPVLMHKVHSAPVATSLNAVDALFASLPTAERKTSASTPRGKTRTPPVQHNKRHMQPTPPITSTNFATPAYADSPPASALPPPPCDWVQSNKKHASTMPKRPHTQAVPMQKKTSPASPRVFSGMDLIRQVSVAAQ